MSNIEFNDDVKILKIKDVAKKLNINEDDIELYGNYKAKINIKKGNKKGKLVLVTSINPTPYGEGKTTVAIGINDALNKLNCNSVAVLREPSLGPVFGVKGGATGGGKSKVIPSCDINLHFTSDFHAITSANNLLCAAIDNHIFQGNELRINPDKVLFKRCIDMNDRALRNIKLSNRNESFIITAASEIMTLFCLAKDFDDLKERLENILIAYSYDEVPIFAKDLKCTEAMAILLKDAIKPNLVQTLENNPVIIHGGPFANIAHGCNSLIATKLGLSLSDYVITEAGFGADLGAEKFFDIKCRNNIKPDCIVLNFSIKALKHNANISKEKINNPSIKNIEKGIINLETHLENIRKYTNNIVLCLNKFETDTIEEINYIKEYTKKLNVEFDICTSYTDGSNGAISLAEKIIKICNNQNDFKFLYDLEDKIENKISIICKEIYRANKTIFTENALNEINKIEKLGCSNYPICIAKTQYSLSDDKSLLGIPINHDIIIDKMSVQTGAKFILVYLGDIISMPGLSKEPSYMNMSINDNKIKGIS